MCGTLTPGAAPGEAAPATWLEALGDQLVDLARAAVRRADDEPHGVGAARPPFRRDFHAVGLAGPAHTGVDPLDAAELLAGATVERELDRGPLPQAIASDQRDGL